MTKRDELIALGGVGAKVRELEWVEMPDRDPESASWIAETDLGRSYRVFAAWWGAQNKYGYVFDGFYHTENEAKAAAQADYERRVLSALEVPAAGDGEPVAWAEIGSRGQALTVRAEKSAFCTTPLYTAQPADAGMREALGWLLDAIKQEVKFTDATPLLKRRFEVAEQALTAPGATTNRSEVTASLEGAAVERVALARDWKTIEEQIATSQGNDLLALLRGYLEINLEPGNDLARLYISRISAILSTIAPDEAAIRAAHIDVLHGLESKISDALNWNGPDKTQGEHMFHMLSVIENSSDMPVDKIARWTGFIQGVLAARGLLDVDEERNRTRPIFAAAIRSGGTSAR